MYLNKLTYRGICLHEEFTDTLKQAMERAGQIAHELCDFCISTEHVLISLLEDPSDLPAQILIMDFNLDVERVKALVREGRPLNPVETPIEQLQLAPRVTRLLERAWEVARERGKEFIGTEHVILILTSGELDCEAYRVLCEVDPFITELHEAILREIM